MKVKLETYKLIRSKTGLVEAELPEVTSYYFETGVRRSIKLVPKWTTWNKEQYGKDEELYGYFVVCVYLSFENIIESFNINISDFESALNSNKHSKEESIIVSLVSNWLDTRTKEQFEADLNTAILNLNKL
jgi:hypothetical protein